ncbi:hypothetical protein [Geothrix edaphica]|uniref:Apea-like HEPN domain-containing protein n=1 Tax=Geothrix edaphica TaxID=2927976 RepID=A0ABQ5Q1X9_9BACT|nr:hypothetical protein [Geothrix edaphica]GLH68416.1 hypothetical protein GETHED_27800 [Geothrix edaphica]
MPVEWKKAPRFKPAVILKKIEGVRSINPEGGVSFSGFELEEYLPTLQSMLEFPAAAVDVSASTLVWRGLTKVGTELTPESFLAAINKELKEQLATKEESNTFLTSLSLDSRNASQRITINGSKVQILSGDYARRFKSRNELLKMYSREVEPTPMSYCKVAVNIKAKSPAAAVSKAFRVLDLQRSLWCLMGNSRMQMTFGKPSLEPINVVRLGSEHTLHLSSGEPAFDGIWFEPGFSEASVFRMEKPDVIKLNSRWARRRVAICPYGEHLASSLVRFVRALDHSDANTAFLRLWGAIEALTTPGQADYDKVVRRCSFIFKDALFHRQVLEHLREFRNANIHAGEESDSARTHCFQLQLYYVNLIWFHIRNATFFRSLDEANAFLDSPSNLKDLTRKIQLTRKAIRFIG